eukprot:CAMPEP_0174750794 /NCGR_PEP_ID=MMETSP1094-20130205/98495_1 /TAXON_ID=156173 /ORGANISM="Chrysochromulina brevifilum, Strain UTEX LB 985" /LENGTH=39 /DNA_ID= /DNA_START= /DNA_END= /DNA_ORIENTATION=
MAGGYMSARPTKARTTSTAEDVPSLLRKLAVLREHTDGG